MLGGGGRLGRLLSRACQVEGVGTWRFQSRQNLEADHAVQLDLLSQPDTIAKAAKGCAAIINLAGVTNAGDGDFAMNTDLAITGLEIARRVGVPRVFLASSAAIYGRSDHLHHEDETPAPFSPYGAAKARMEDAIRHWDAQHTDVEPVIMRLGNIAGADQLLSRLVLGDARGVITLDQFPNGEGPQRTYIGPGALLCCFAALATAPICPGTLNVSLPGFVAMADLLSEIGADWRFGKAPDTAIPKVGLDVTRLSGVWADIPEKGTARGIIGDLRQIMSEVPR